MGTSKEYKVQLGDSTTGTSTSTTYKISSPPPTEYGWACPRCNRINAPWKSTCDCAGNNWYPTWYPWNYSEPWWKQVTCDSGHPETTTWKAPSSVCTSDSSMNDPNVATTTWSAINTVGGSDYYNSITHNWENVPKNQTNKTQSKYIK